MPRFALFQLCCLVCANVAWAQTEPTIDLQQLQQQQPSFLVRVEVDRTSRQYHDGEQLTVKVVSEMDAFVYVLYEQADGKLFQIFPNSRQPNNRVAARQEVQIPAREDLFRWRVGPPFGKETVKVIATAQPVKALSDPKFKAKDFNPLPRTVLKGIALELEPEEGASPGSPAKPGTQATNTARPAGSVSNPPGVPVAWAEAAVQLVTSKAEPTPAPAKRVGVFFGVSDQKFAAYAEADGGRNPNLATPHADAKVMNDLMKGVGQLQETRLFTNQAVTRQNLETTICQWLPNNTRPGDTVVIYYSGHGGQVADDNGDEPDGKDEFIVPYDYFGSAEAAGMMKLEKTGKLPAEDAPILAEAKQLVAQAGQNKAFEHLTRKSSVTDDVFGHWLQSLDGRQVVVILDICHSGGFADQEKNLIAEPKSNGFDFLDRELSRLKDIGQSNTALLSSSATSELSFVRVERDLSVMTYYLAESLRTHAGPLVLKDAHAECERGMVGYFQSHPRPETQHPKLYDIAVPVYLKP